MAVRRWSLLVVIPLLIATGCERAHRFPPPPPPDKPETTPVTKDEDKKQQKDGNARQMLFATTAD